MSDGYPYKDWQVSRGSLALIPLSFEWLYLFYVSLTERKMFFGCVWIENHISLFLRGKIECAWLFIDHWHSFLFGRLVFEWDFLLWWIRAMTENWFEFLFERFFIECRYLYIANKNLGCLSIGRQSGYVLKAWYCLHL